MNQRDIIRSIDELNKAISVTTVQNLELVREDLQEEMAIAAPIDTPLRNRLQRIKGNGKAHAFYRLEPTLDPVTGQLFLGTAPGAGYFAKGGIPTANQGTYKYVSVPYTTVGDLVEVTFFDQQAGASYTDVRQRQIKNKMINTGLFEEWGILYGDSSQIPSGGGAYFDGLNKQIVYNAVDAGGRMLSLGMVNSALHYIRRAGGHGKAAVMSYREQQKFSELVLGSYYRLVQDGGVGGADVRSGVNVSKWAGPHGVIDIIGSRFINEAYGQLSSMFIIDDTSTLDDGNAIQMVDLMPISAIDLAIVATSYKTVVMEFTTMQVTAPQFQGRIDNIAGDPNQL
jgi:hypothetical protein